MGVFFNNFELFKMLIVNWEIGCFLSDIELIFV